MATNHVLIDYENVQPKNLAALKDVSKGRSFKVYVFVGANQSRIPRELVFEMQSLGRMPNMSRLPAAARTPPTSTSRFYLGSLSESDADDEFHVVSKDTGFDPLIRHLQAKNIKAARRRDLFEIPWLKSQRVRIPWRENRPRHPQLRSARPLAAPQGQDTQGVDPFALRPTV